MPFTDPVARKAYLQKWQKEHREQQREYHRNYRVVNYDAQTAYARRYYKEAMERDPEGMRAKKHKEWLATRYKLTVEQYRSLLESQGNKCAICGKLGEVGHRKGLHIDHNHTTGMVRGLLCGTCNRGIGTIGEDPDLLEAAARYLRERGW